MRKKRSKKHSISTILFILDLYWLTSLEARVPAVIVVAAAVAISRRHRRHPTSSLSQSLLSV